jgi:hypothetical protein
MFRCRQRSCSLSCILGGGVMARDVVLRVRGSGRLVPAIGTPLIPAAYSVQCAISTLAQMMTRRTSLISTKAASQLTTFLPAVLSRRGRFDSGSRGLSDSNRAGNGAIWLLSGVRSPTRSTSLARTAYAAGSPGGHRSVCLDNLAHRNQPRLWA